MTQTLQDSKTSEQGFVGGLGPIMAELTRQQQTKTDVIVDVRSVKLGSNGKGLTLQPKTPAVSECLGVSEASVNDNAMTQWCERASVKVPVVFARGLLASGNGDVLADTINTLNERSGGSALLRLLDGRNRAVLSDRYRVIDHYDIMFPMLDVIRERAGVVLNASLTDTKMSLTVVIPQNKAVLPAEKWGSGSVSHLARCDPNGIKALKNVTGEDPIGTVYPMIRFSNSETGDGGMSATFGAFAPRCLNGMVLEQTMRVVHLGGKREHGLYKRQRDTEAAHGEWILREARDAITGAFDPKTWNRVIAQMQAAATREIANPTMVVDRLVEESLISKSDRDNLLAYFLRDYDQTALGLSQAVARLAQDGGAEQYTGYEAMAGAIVRDPSMCLATA